MPILARAFAKPYDIIIMDEPSSALDPLAEYELNKVSLIASFVSVVLPAPLYPTRAIFSPLRIVKDIFLSTSRNIGIVGYLVVRYMLDSDFTLGGFSVGINATWKLFVQVSRIIDCFSRLNEDSVYADKFRTFAELEPQIKNGSVSSLLQKAADFSASVISIF